MAQCLGLARSADRASFHAGGSAHDGLAGLDPGRRDHHSNRRLRVARAAGRHTQILSVWRLDRLLGNRLDHILGSHHFQHAGVDGRFRTLQKLDDPPRHRRHSNSDHHAGVGLWRAARGARRVWLSLGRCGADSCRPRDRGPRRNSRCGARKQRSRFLRSARRAYPGSRRGNRVADARVVGFHRKRRGGSCLTAALGADLPGEWVGRCRRGVAAGDCGLSFVCFGAMAGGSLPGPLFARFERSPGFLLGVIYFREDVAAEDDCADLAASLFPYLLGRQQTQRKWPACGKHSAAGCPSSC